MLFEVIAHFPYFQQFKINKKKIVQELEAENPLGLEDDQKAEINKKILQQKKENSGSNGKCNC